MAFNNNNNNNINNNRTTYVKYNIDKTVDPHYLGYVTRQVRV